MYFKCTECWFPKLRSGVNGALNLEHSQEAVKRWKSWDWTLQVLISSGRTQIYFSLSFIILLLKNSNLHLKNDSSRTKHSILQLLHGTTHLIQ